MKKPVKDIVSAIVVLFILVNSSIAQDLTEENEFTPFINGWEYHIVITQLGHPFLASKNWEYGTIHHRERSFRDILVNYDIHQNVLIVPVFRNGQNISVVLNPQDIDGFSLDGREFINLNNHLELCEDQYTGYYQLAYRGGILLLFSLKKEIIDEDVMNASDFKAEKEVYLFHEGILHPLKGNRSLYKLFPAQKKELRRFMRNNNIYINQANDRDFLVLAEFIDKKILEN